MSLPPHLSHGRLQGGTPSHNVDLAASSSASNLAMEDSMRRGKNGAANVGVRGALHSTQTSSMPHKVGRDPDTVPESKSLTSYGHHRQTSIVNGVQHSRNVSFANSPATSPLSPQWMTAGGGGTGGFEPPYTVSEDAEEFSSTSSQTLTQSGASWSTTSIPLSSPASNAEHQSLSNAEPTQKRPERVQSTGKGKRDAPHNRSNSVHPQHQELKAVGEYALHHLFNSFVGQADRKIHQCITDPNEPEPRVESICGPGVDPSFDQLIIALGHIARQKPKPLTDTLMFWRRAKSDAANNARIELNQSKGTPLPANGLPRRNTEPGQASASGHSSNNSLAHSDQSLVERRRAVLQAERRSTVSIYLLCRVLMEIIGQSSLAYITPDMAERLEDLIYTQLKAADLESLEESPFKQANWNIFAQLLGVMSELNFAGVSAKFLTDLEKWQKYLSVKSLATKELESKSVLVIRGMRHLKLRFQSEVSWARSCEFMQALGRIFAVVHGATVKYAFCETLEQLLLPVAGTVTTQINVHKWKDFISIVKPRLSDMILKQKHWSSSFPMMAALLCVSPAEAFASQWLSIVSPLQPKLKDRATRPLALRGICRLVWTYLYRTVETQTATAKKLDEVIKLVFQPGKKSYLSTEPAVAEPLIQLIRIIGFKNQDFCFRTIIFPLMNWELFDAGKELKVENLEPERMVIGIRAFLAIMADLEKGEQPPFPVNFGNEAIPSIALPTLPNSPRPAMNSASKFTTLKEERLSRPVMTTTFGEVAKEYYTRFCKILGEITIICDNAFGGQAVLDEKFSVPTPKTPMADAFSLIRRDDVQVAVDPRQGFYDLLYVAVQALPRCLSPHIPFNSLVNLLCTGTAHVQDNIAISSAQSLKAIARQAHAQQVTIGFARFIFNFDDRYSTMSDGGMLGHDHIESTLSLYVELLQIWIEEIKQKTRKAVGEIADENNRGAQLDLSGVWAHVDEVESHGLFFLCSPSRRVRSYAVTVLRLVTEFNTALGKDTPRFIQVLEGPPQRFINVDDEKLSVAERSRLQRGIKSRDLKSTLVELCSSDVPYDSTLWFKVFPNLIRIGFDMCPFAVTLTRDIICVRIAQMQKLVAGLSEGPRNPLYGVSEAAQAKIAGRLASTAPEVVIEQWKLYLIFACTTVTYKGNQQMFTSAPPQHARKSSKSSYQSYEKINSAADLFARVINLLSASNPAVRDAVVSGLGSINSNVYRTLLDSLQTAVIPCNDEAKARLGTHQRTGSSPRRTRRTDYLRTEITNVYKLTSHFLRNPEVYNDDWILNHLVSYTKDLRLFLNDAEVQNEWGFQKLRTHYCGLVEELFEGINRTKDPLRWMPFQSRKAAFALMEDWCGYSPNQSQILQREDDMKRSILDREFDIGNKGIVTAAMEIEKRDLRTAALSAMAALCGGPVSITTDSKVNLQFDVRRMLAWIDAIFATPSDKTHAIGRRALKNLILHNKEHPYLLTRSIERCYLAESSKALESYFEVVTQILTETEDYVLPFWKVLGAGLYTLGDGSNRIRVKAARLLRTLEERQQKSSKLQDLDISISDKTTAVYKLAQFEMSRRLAKQHSELAFHVFSEFTYYFKELQPDHQRNMVAAMLPWIQTIELQLDPNGGPTATSYMVLVNLFEITVRCGTALHNEIQALWQSLATGPHAGNVQLVLDFIISLCLDKREQNFVEYAKQIVVHLSSTPAGLKVVEFLLLQISPKAMVQEKREPTTIPPDAASLPYLAEISTVLPRGNKQSGYSLGQLCLILLVDLVVSGVQLAKESVPLVLQVVFVLWDHYTPLVQDQAREMLVHLIHELVISKMDDASASTEKRRIEDLADSVRRHDPKVVWAYEDSNGKDNERDDKNVPEAMPQLAEEVIRAFSITYPNIRPDWGRVTLTWATSCPVRHLACRSFQLFRCIQTSLDQQMLSDMLARLSNTIADDETDILSFSIEILTTLKTVIRSMKPDDIVQYPQLFWTACACLDTIHEREFMESLAIFDSLLDKLDLSDPAVVKLLREKYPQRWEGTFEGVQALIYKGIRSGVCLDRSLALLQRLVTLPPSDIVGDESRLLFTILANFPQFLRSFDQEQPDPSVYAAANVLAGVASDQMREGIMRTLEGFANRRFRSSKDFLAQSMTALRAAFFPEFEFKTLTFLMGSLTNITPWFKIEVMRMLCVLIQDTDMRKPDIASQGPDLIAPLLRLLQTEFCPQALEVLDNVMIMTATPMEKHHLRMSMAGSHSSRAFRKEYARTQCLYGIPEESGWSIPMPAVYSSTTRNNVHAVFYTCAAAKVSDVAEVPTPDIEFYTEEDQYRAYVPDYRSQTMTSDDPRDMGNMGDLVMRLDMLDDFFEDDAGPGNRTTTSTSHTYGRQFSPSPVDAQENLYDQQTLPLLHKSLNHSASVSSFQAGFTDAKMPSSRDGAVMTPTAFNAYPGAAAGSVLLPNRPSLHSRSVTSPDRVQHSRTPTGADIHYGDAMDHAFSDDDMSSDNAGTSDKPYVVETTNRPAPQGVRSGLRLGMRRLTGSNDAKEKERIREALRAAQMQKSPKVPKVPDMYLQQQGSTRPGEQ